MATFTLKDNAADIRTDLGLGTAATATVGTGANNVVKLSTANEYPAIDFSLFGGSGKVKQFVSTVDTNQTAFSANSATQDTGLGGLSITPTSSSNKIIVMYTDSQMNATGSYSAMNMIYRGGTNISGNCASELTSYQLYGDVNIVVLDEPNTTSAVTYYHYMYHQNGTGYLSANGFARRLTAIEIEP